MICDSCFDKTPEDEIHEHNGMNLCDDCYMDAMQPVTGCNPWAVYLATRTETTDPVFSETQEIILKLVENGKRAPVAELLDATGLDLTALRKEIVPLRHMEKVVWEQQSGGDVALKQFE